MKARSAGALDVTAREIQLVPGKPWTLYRYSGPGIGNKVLCLGLEGSNPRFSSKASLTLPGSIFVLEHQTRSYKTGLECRELDATV